jgi:hypothetical protein
MNVFSLEEYLVVMQKLALLCHMSKIRITMSMVAHSHTEVLISLGYLVLKNVLLIRIPVGKMSFGIILSFVPNCHIKKVISMGYSALKKFLMIRMPVGKMPIGIILSLAAFVLRPLPALPLGSGFCKLIHLDQSTFLRYLWPVMSI